MSDTTDETFLDRMTEAVFGAYYAAPQGEGVMGGLEAAAQAAVYVADGMSPGEAVARAIGDRGLYGVARTHGLVPRPKAWGIQPDKNAPGVYLEYETTALRDECVKALEAAP